MRGVKPKRKPLTPTDLKAKLQDLERVYLACKDDIEARGIFVPMDNGKQSFQIKNPAVQMMLNTANMIRRLTMDTSKFSEKDKALEESARKWEDLIGTG